METYAVYLKPRGALATYPLSSDTLFGAVCWGIRVLGLMQDHELTDWLENQVTNPLFAFSQAFPAYFAPKQTLRLYPRPVNFQATHSDLDKLAVEWQKTFGVKPPPQNPQAKMAEIGKKFKKFTFISEGVLKQISQKTLTPGHGLRALLEEFTQTSGLTLRSSALWLINEAANLPEKLYATEAVQHNHIDRIAGATVEGLLFFHNETFFAEGAGLWALLRTDAQTMQAYIAPALRYLADTGFGGERTTGKGQFDVSVEVFSALPKNAQAQAMMSLSYYLPQAGEFDVNSAPLAYTLKTLRPKRESKYLHGLSADAQTPPIYKQALRVFEPGSVFSPRKQKEIYGQLQRLTPPEQDAIYQSGAALMVGL